jgi:alanine dehydrogenase
MFKTSMVTVQTHVQGRQGNGSKMLHRVIKGSMHDHAAIFGQGTVNTTACHTVVGLKTEKLVGGNGVERLHRHSLQHRQALQQFKA